jgi:hypothetical protein
MESKLVARKNEIENELRLGVRDPQRKQLLLTRLLLIERDFAAMGFSPEDVERNGFSYDPNKKDVGNKQYYIPLPAWTVSDTTNKDTLEKVARGNSPSPAMQKYRQEQFEKAKRYTNDGN